MLKAQAPKKVLIVEDEKPMARALELKLERAGFDVETAFDGETALEILKKRKFAAVVLDLVMPKVDGFTVLKQLKSQKKKLPVFVMSNLGQEEDIARARELGASEYFVKSDTTIADIVDHVKNILIT